MPDHRAASTKTKQSQSKRDDKVRRAIRRVLKPKNWADDVIGRPAERVTPVRQEKDSGSRS